MYTSVNCRYPTFHPQRLARVAHSQNSKKKALERAAVCLYSKPPRRRLRTSDLNSVYITIFLMLFTLDSNVFNTNEAHLKKSGVCSTTKSIMEQNTQPDSSFSFMFLTRFIQDGWPEPFEPGYNTTSLLHGVCSKGLASKVSNCDLQ